MNENATEPSPHSGEDMDAPALGSSLEPAIRIRKLSKRFRFENKPTPFSLLSRFGRGNDSVDPDDDVDEPDDQPDDPARETAPGTTWALRNVSLEIPAGTVLGIIGRNGSGKTTLLKVLARLTLPTEGRVEIRGRVAPVVEAASGLLQPALSGRENIELIARFFGVPQKVVHHRIDEIAGFAELGEGQLRARVRSYSSGLSRRLAFATVLNLQPDILLADELLSLGDRTFREKCLDKIEEDARHGLTVLLASHDMALVRRLCDVVIRLEGGSVTERGDPAEVTNRYEGVVRSGVPLASSSPKRSFNEHLSIYAASIRSPDGDHIETLRANDDAIMTTMLDVAAGGVTVRCVIALLGEGEPRVRIVQPEAAMLKRAGRYTLSVRIPGGSLPDGFYVARVGVQVELGGVESRVVRPNAFSVDVEDIRDPDEIADAEEADDRDPAEPLELPALRWDVDRDGSWFDDWLGPLSRHGSGGREDSA